MSKVSLLPVAAMKFSQIAPAGGGPTLLSFLPMILIFGALYFLMVAPQQKKQKEHKKMLEALQSGDEVVTSGGIHGVITNVKADRFVVRIADNTKIEVGKAFIAEVTKREGASDK